MVMQRRELLKAGLAGLGLNSLQEAWALGAPLSNSFGSAPELLPFQGLNGQDLAAQDLQIEGRLPRQLRGVYYKNGPALMARGGQRYQHWFDGDGLVQAWRFGDGRASHQARFVQTAKFKAESAAGRFLLPAFGTAIEPRMPTRGSDGMNVANTSVLLQQDKLYALWEGGSAHELDPLTLSTRGLKTWAPDLAGMPFSAHPKVEADGTVWNFGTMAGRMALYQISARGQVLRSEVFAVPASTAFVHDFVVSQNYLVFLLPPLHLDVETLRAGASMAGALRWQAAESCKVLVVAKADFSHRRILEIPACMVFHFGNAWDDGQTLQLDYVQSREMPLLTEDFKQLMQGERPLSKQASSPRFMKIDLASGRVELQSRDEEVEFPVVDPRVVAQRYRHVYYPTALETGARWGFNGLLHLDLQSGRRQRYCFGNEVVVEEHVLVPKPGSGREGEGWLLGLCYDSRRQRSFASVFDAQALDAGPLAKVWLPYWVTYGFHGKFYAAG
ncbi:carotenoid cleavage dioxygenase [Paucibacter oligotrophus]|uniref:Carotenoid cleavage dioxygenase n=1 Tax=Roseateles oligotrophus TaxID=1769250 RepID=A0A840LCP2_9BURK|nr:carotenoid oxygenase family protein [Roseateles oligotrophus]MBB4843958.1 carotenoid cleavage dioxygenase [Roseateles oligotrophus]